MVAIVGGGELGLSTASGQVLGQQGQIGVGTQGRSGERVAVNAVTGNLILQRQDEFVAGLGPDIGILRTYNSQGLFSDDNGDNWRLGFSRRLTGLIGTVNTAGSSVVRVGEDGAEIVYSYDAARAAYVSTQGAGAHDQLTYNGGTNQWTWIDGDTHRQEIYDNANNGRLISVRDVDGNALTIGYNASGLVNLITDANGERTYIDYQAGANISQIRTVNSSNATLTRVRYGYDASNRLTSVTVDLSPEDNSIADGQTYITTYTYDGSSKRVASVTQTDGSRLEFTYVLVNGDYRIATVRDVRGADIRTTTYNYDTTNRRTTITDPVGQVTEFNYDTSKRLTSIRLPAVGGVSQQTSFSYDAANNVIGVTDARGNVFTYEYDANGNRVLERDQAGNTITRTFSTSNQVLTETAYTVPDPDGAGAGQAGGAQTTRYVYDAEQHLRFTISPEGRVAEFRYNAAGQRVATISYSANLYSVAGLSTTQSPSEAQLTTWLSGVNKASSVRTDTTYDTRGQVSQVTAYATVDTNGNGVVDGLRSITQYVYDQAGNLLQTIDPRGVEFGGHVTTHTYDGLGRQLTTTNAKGHLTTSVYDDPNRQTTVTLANGLVTATTYDRGGQAVSISRSGSEGALGTTQYTYDSLGRLVSEQDPTGVRQYWIYDAAGRQVGHIDGVGAFAEYVYNGNNQLTKTIQYHNAVSSATLSAAASNPSALTLSGARPANHSNDRVDYRVYDAAGRLKKSIDAERAVVEYFYDGTGRLTDTLQYYTRLTSGQFSGLWNATGEISPADANATVVSHSADRRNRQFYSADGLLLGSLDGEGFLTEHLYNSAGQRTQTIRYAILTASANWATGTLSTLRPATHVRDQNTYYIYNSKNQQVGVVDAESYLTETQYDLAGNTAATIRYATKVTYTPGNSVAATRPAANSEDQRVLYTYDELNQLVRTDSLPGDVVTTYAYDSVGNRTATTRALGATEQRTTLQRFDSLGRLSQALTAEGAQALAALGASPTQAQIDGVWAQYSVTYAYDTAGRRISVTDPLGNKTRFYYDAAGRLTHTINALGEVVHVTYNQFGDVTENRRYGTRLSAAVLATLPGGLVNTTLTNAVAAITNSALDTVERFTAFNRRGQVLTSLDALNNDTLYIYNSFGELTVTNRKIDSANTRLYEANVYNRRGEITYLRRDTNSTGGVIAGSTNVRKYYDAFGRVTRTTDARGNNWDASYDRLGRTITTTAPGSVAVVVAYDAFGRQLSYTDELFNTTLYSYNTANRQVTITSPEGIVTTTATNRHGETVRVTDGRGNVTSYDYDANGQLKTVTTPAGISTHNYDRAGQKIETVDGNGVVTRYTYDAVGRVLTRQVDPIGLNLTSKTFYDAKGQAVWQQDANGVWTQTLYNLKGEVTSVIVDPASIPNASSTQTAVTLVSNSGALNLRTDYTYDARGKTLSVTEGVGSTQPKVTTYTYDKLGRRTEEAVDPNGLNIRTSYVYDLNDNMVAKIDGAGSLNYTTRYVYDAQNRLSYSVDATGAVTQTGYDDAGRVIWTIAYANAISLSGLGSVIIATDITGRLSVSAANDQSEFRIYNADGQVRFSIDAKSYVIGYVYDAAGNVIERTRYANAITVPGTVSTSTVASAITTNTQDQTERTVYDAANRAIFQIDAEGYVTQSTYDNVGRLRKQVTYANKLAGTFSPNVAPAIVTSAPGSGAYVITNSSKDRTTRNVYDTAGRLRFAVDGEGYITERRFDALGRETQRIQYANAYTVNDAHTVASLSALVPATPGSNEPVELSLYDDAGRLLATIDADDNIIFHDYDAVGRETSTVHISEESSTTRREFDAAGRLIGETRGYGTADASTVRYTLDALGRRVAITDPRGVELAESDDAWAQATRQSLGLPITAAGLSAAQKSSLLAQYTTTQQFDANGNVILVTDAVGATIATQYDAFGNAVRVTDQRGNSGYFYFDKNNQLVMQVDPEGYATVTTYTAFGTVERITQYYNKVTGTPTVGVQPSVTANASRDQITLIQHDKRNLQTRITDAENFYETMSYDAFGNKVSYRNKLGGIYSYTYDRKGNVITETSPAVAGYPSGIVKEFLYDARDNVTQIIEAKGLPEQRTTQYQYDRLNRQTARIGEAFSAFNANGSGSTNMVVPAELQKYDARGNVIESTDAVGNRTLYYYDALNRQVAQLSPLGQLTVWKYNDGSKPISELRYSVTVPLPATAGGIPPTVTTDPNVREFHYQYDANNRLVATTQKNLMVGEQSAGASAYEIVVMDVQSQIIYDATGNVVREIDGRGNATWYYYDKLGRMTVKIDAGNYVTAWTYDGAGNVTQERRYATPLASVPTSTTTPPALPANHADDRVTQLSYDRMNRLVGKVTLNVVYGEVYEHNGMWGSSTASAEELFVYDGLGNVRTYMQRKVNNPNNPNPLNNWEESSYSYDVLGRLTTEAMPLFTDYTGATVRPTTNYEYDGLNRVKREIERGTDNAVETDDRITRYTYNAGGHVYEATDAAGAVTRYEYDAAGNVTRETLLGRTNTDGVVVDDAVWYRYNAANQEIWQQDINSGEIKETRYNVFGEVTGKRINGGGTGAAWQETADYDNAGRVWRSNSGDGVYKAYIYDANDNATLNIASAGDNIAVAATLADVLRLANTSLTISQYDARNLLTDTYQEQGSVNQFATQTINDNFSGGAISIGPDSTIGNNGSIQPLVQGTVANVTGDVVVDGSYIYGAYGGIYGANLNVQLPNLTALGSGDVRVEVIPVVTNADGSAGEIYYPAFSRVLVGNPVSASFQQLPVSYYDDPNLGTLSVIRYNVNIYKITSAGNILITQTSTSTDLAESVTIPIDNTYFTAQSPSANRLVLQYRPEGDTSGWTVQTLSPTIPGIFSFEYSGLTTGTAYEFRYITLDAIGNVLASEAGRMVPTGSGLNVQQAPMDHSGNGRVFTDSNGRMNLTELGADVIQLNLRYRTQGSSGAWTTVVLNPAVIGGVSTPGWFVFDPVSDGLSGNYDYRIEGENAAGEIVNSAVSAFTVGSPAPTVGATSSPTAVGTVSVSATAPTTSTTTTSNVVSSTYGVSAYDLNTTVNLVASAYSSRVDVTYYDSSAGVTRTVSGIAAANQTSITLSFHETSNVYVWLMGASTANGTSTVNVKVYSQQPQGEVLTVDGTVSLTFDSQQTIAPGSQAVNFANQPANSSRLVFMTRPQGSNQGWSVYNAFGTGTDYSLDLASWAANTYEFHYLTLHSDGTVLNSETGTLVYNGASSSITQSAQSIGGAGHMLMDSTNVLHILEQGAATGSQVQYRVAGSGSAWSSPVAAQNAGNGIGWFTFNPASLGLSGNYELLITATNSNGTVINKVTGTFATDNPNSVSALTGYVPPATVTAPEDLAGVTGSYSITNNPGAIVVGGTATLSFSHVQTSPPGAYGLGGAGHFTASMELPAHTDTLRVRVVAPSTDASQPDVVLMDKIATPGQNTVTGDTPMYWSDYSMINYPNALVQVFRQTTNGDVKLYEETYANIWYQDTPITVNSSVVFNDQPIGTSHIIFMSRSAGSGDGWTITSVAASSYTWPSDNWQKGSNEFRYWALDAAGNVLNAQQGSLVLSPDAVPAVGQTSQLLGGVGDTMMDDSGWLYFTEQGSVAQSLTIQYRATGSNEAWSSPVNVAQAGFGNGWFRFNPAAHNLAGQYDYLIVAKNSGDQVVNRSAGSFVAGDADSVTPLRGYQGSLNVVHFSSQPVDADSMVLSYRRVGTSTWTSLTLESNSQGIFDWDGSNLVAGQYEFNYQVLNAGGTSINQAQGVVEFDDTPRVITHTSNSPSQAVGTGWLITGQTGDEVQHRSQSHNAFGEVASETDGLGRTTELRYNTLGLLVEKQDPETDITAENGYRYRGRPTTTYSYDLAGRLVATMDANNNRTTYVLLDGFGSGGNDEEPRVAHEYRFGAWGVQEFQHSQKAFDIFGDARILTEGNGEDTRITTQEFDKMGRVTRITRPERTGYYEYVSLGAYGGYVIDIPDSAAYDDFAYDQAGNRISHTKGIRDENGVYIESATETMDYDSLGRMTQYSSFTDLTTQYDYLYDNAIKGVGGVAIGGYRHTTTQSHGRSSIDDKDYFGRTTWHQDLGAHEFTYAYNHAGWLMQQSSTAGQHIGYEYYGNGYIKSIHDYSQNTVAAYAYDIEGNRTVELYGKVAPGTNTITEMYQNATVTYDELNRVARIQDARADIHYEYDANGNRRRVFSTYPDYVNGGNQVQDYWYTYDGMNRFVLTKARFTGGSGEALVRGTSLNDASQSITIDQTDGGVQIGYNEFSERASAVYSIRQADGTYTQSTEVYDYSPEGYLETTSIDGVLRARRKVNEYGTTQSYTEYNTNGSVMRETISHYDLDNRLGLQSVVPSSGSTTTTAYYYEANGGALYRTEQKTGDTTVNTYYSYEWWDDAKTKTITSQPYNKNAPGWKPGKSHFFYDANGHLRQVDDVVGGRSIRFNLDAQGLILSRNELVGSVNNGGGISNGTLDIYHHYIYFNGHTVGDVGNDGVENRSYGEELAITAREMNRKSSGKPGDRYKNWQPISSADFDQSYQPISASYPGNAPGTYTVKAGDTLQSIALALWGDSAMWYLLADANGLASSDELTPGQVLTVPNKVANIHNNSQTFGVYDPGRIIGDTQPTLPEAPPPPRPKGGKGCGVIGQIIVIVVAIVVTIYTAGAASGLASATTSTFSAGVSAVGGANIGAAVVGGAVGSIASQGVGIALGVQDGFSWSGVAMGAIGAGVGAGIGSLASGGAAATTVSNASTLSQFGSAVGRAALGNAVTQGIAVATGLQEKFSWKQVAASAAGAGVAFGANAGFSAVGISNEIVRGTLTGIVAGGVQARVSGEKPNWGLIAANSFGNSLGNAVVDQAVNADQQKQQEALEQQQAKNAGQMTADLDRRMAARMDADLAAQQEAIIAAADMTPRERAAARTEALRTDSTAADDRPAWMDEPVQIRNGNEPVPEVDSLDDLSFEPLAYESLFDGSAASPTAFDYTKAAYGGFTDGIKIFHENAVNFLSDELYTANYEGGLRETQTGKSIANLFGFGKDIVTDLPAYLGTDIGGYWTPRGKALVEGFGNWWSGTNSLEKTYDVFNAIGEGALPTVVTAGAGTLAGGVFRGAKTLDNLDGPVPNKAGGSFTLDDLLATAKPSSATLRDSTRSTFLDGDATHIILDEPLTVYRAHGGKAGKVGRFTTLDTFDSRVDVRNNLALLQEWGNSVTKMTTVELPKGTSVWVGRAAPQVGKNGKTLPGGGSQIFIDGKLDADWFKDTVWFRSDRSKN